MSANHTRELSDIQDELNSVQCTLACATVALGKAQDDSDLELGAKAWKVIHDCNADLQRLIDEDLGKWMVTHEYSPKESAHA